jgi:hypothetical protein
MKLRGPTTLETFRKIRHDGHGSSLNLTFKAKVSGKSVSRCCFVDVGSQLPRLLPSNEIFKFLDSAAQLSPQYSVLITVHLRLAPTEDSPDR